MIRVTLAASALLLAFAIPSQSAFAGDRAGIQQAGYADDLEDSAERYASGAESFWDNLCDCVRERRLLGYKRVQKKHRKFLYPECSPACSPTFGYHHTQWRPFPECEYVWTSAPAVPAWPSPAALPGASPVTPSPMFELTPQEAEPGPLPAPYFPEPAPQASPVQPAIPPAPPAESDAVSLPIEGDSLIDLVAQPQVIPNSR